MLPQAQGWTFLRWTLLLSTFTAAHASAQAADRIWGRVHTTEGQVHAGFIRWGPTRAGWADILYGLRELPDENYFAWLEAHDRERATRTIELRGYRITWNEVDPDFPMEVLSGVRFGHLDSLVVLDSERARLTLRSEASSQLAQPGSAEAHTLVVEPRGGTARRRPPRQVLVDVPGAAEVELDWDELERVVFSAAPAGAVPAARLLYGTVEDRAGNRHTGYLAWDQDEILESDELNGRETRHRNDHRIRFDRIRSLTRTSRGTRVELTDGGTLELEGANDVDRGNRGVRIADPALGVVVVPWEHLDAVRLHTAGGAPGAHAAFEDRRLLAGTVVTREGEEIRGELRWDADEAGSWDILNGAAAGVDYGIEFGLIRRIAPGGEDGAAVTLADGRTLELGGSRDVNADNKGVMVASRQPGTAPDGDPDWRLIPWADIREVRFDPAAPAANPPPGGLCLLAVLPSPVGAQEARDTARFAEDAFADPAARTVFEAARANWASVEQSVLRYQALIRQRTAAAIRAPLKDRVIYRDETAVRAFWDHEYDAVVQVLGAKSQYPGQETARREGDLEWLDDLAFDEPFDPASDRLLLGWSDPGEQPDDDFWIQHPLAEGADSLYRYASGDTLTLSLPDGRRLRTVQLDVLPREADAHRIVGTLWIEPESGALVRAVYRLSREFDAIRDLEDLQEEEEEGSFRYVPGVLKPWTFDLSMIAIDYSLWNFEVWLPLYMRMEGLGRAGIVKFPVTLDISYEMESVTTRRDIERLEAARREEAARTAAVPPEPDEAREADAPQLVERRFETRDEAMAFVAELLSREGGVDYESAEGDDFAAERDAYILAPRERSLVATSPELPPPIWEEAAGFPSDEQIGEFVESLAGLPTPEVPGIPWSLDWGWGRPGLIRYNRVEGPAAGLHFETSLAGPWSLNARAFLGVSDLEPKGRLDFERETVRRRLGFGVYRELASASPHFGRLGFGNSLNALFLGRDEGEYYRATGADLTWRPTAVARQWFEVRAYAERQDPLETRTGFAVFRLLDDDWDFRPNVAADAVEELGAEIRLSPWRGGDPHLAQIGLELYGHAARRRPVSGGDQADYARASATMRAAMPLAGRDWRLGLELAGGTTFGEATAQRAWFLGGTRTLRGHAPSILWGRSFGRGRVEVARTYDVGTVSVFTDAGWADHFGGHYLDDEDIGTVGTGRPGHGPARPAADTDGLLWGIGVGSSLLDGLMRLDVSYGLNGPAREFWIALYLDSLL